MSSEFKLYKAILHILDNENNMAVFSDVELSMESQISSFIEKHITRAFEDDNLKSASFLDTNNLFIDSIERIRGDNETFIEESVKIANGLFEYMKKNIDIKPCDLICALFTLNQKHYVGFLKLNYKSGYTHYVQSSDNGNINELIKHKTLLPSDSNRVDECFFINFEDYLINIIEKKYEIDGKKEYYLSKIFLNAGTNLSDNDKVRILNNVTKKVNKKYYEDEYEKPAELKKVITENIEENESIKVEEVIKNVYKNDLKVQEECIEEIKKAGIYEEEIKLSPKIVEKKFTTHKIKTSNGIEINFPSNLYNNKDEIEFINNPDGTVSLLIKNINTKV